MPLPVRCTPPSRACAARYQARPPGYPRGPPSHRHLQADSCGRPPHAPPPPQDGFHKPAAQYRPRRDYGGPLPHAPLQDGFRGPPAHLYPRGDHGGPPTHATPQDGFRAASPHRHAVQIPTQAAGDNGAAPSQHYALYSALRDIVRDELGALRASGVGHSKEALREAVREELRDWREDTGGDMQSLRWELKDATSAIKKTLAEMEGRLSQVVRDACEERETPLVDAIHEKVMAEVGLVINAAWDSVEDIARVETRLKKWLKEQGETAARAATSNEGDGGEGQPAAAATVHRDDTKSKKRPRGAEASNSAAPILAGQQQHHATGASTSIAQCKTKRTMSKPAEAARKVTLDSVLGVTQRPERSNASGSEYLPPSKRCQISNDSPAPTDDDVASSGNGSNSGREQDQCPTFNHRRIPKLHQPKGRRRFSAEKSASSSSLIPPGPTPRSPWQGQREEGRTGWEGDGLSAYTPAYFRPHGLISNQAYAHAQARQGCPSPKDGEDGPLLSHRARAELHQKQWRRQQGEGERSCGGYPHR